MSAGVEIIPFLKSLALFNDFSENELETLLPYIEPQKFAKGSFIMKEGELGDTLCIIRKGQVEVVKEDGKRHHRLAIVGPGECVGEMALFDKSMRSASVLALDDVDVVLLALGESKLPDQLVLHLAKKISSRLRSTNEIVVKSLQEELKITETHDQMGELIIQLLILITSYFFIFKLFSQHGSESHFIRVFTLVLIAMIGVCGVTLLLRTGYSLEFYGLTLKNWRRHVVESVIYTLPLLGLLVVIKWSLITFVSKFKDFPLWEFGQEKPFWHFFAKEQHENYLMLLVLYVVFVPVQEFVVRGCLQGSFENFFRGTSKTWRAIFASNLLFMLFHGLKSFSFVVVAFIFGVFWGWLYARQRSIVGVSISHILVGLWGLGALGFQNILIY